MIKINLLPQEMVKGGRAAARRPGIETPTPSPIVYLLLIVIYAGVAYGGYWVWSNISQSKATVAARTTEKGDLDKKVEKIKTQFEFLQAADEVAVNEAAVIKALDPVGGILWCEKLNMLSDLRPEDVFVTQVTVTENVTEVETPESIQARKRWENGGKKGPQPATTKRPLIRQTLQISGVTTGDDSVKRLTNVMVFLNTLRDYFYKSADGKIIRFMDNFEDAIALQPIVANAVAGVDVNDFSFVLTTKPLGSTN